MPAAAQIGAEDFVYLQPSKEIAETGEDLFFKAYLMDRRTMALSSRSRTLYLEIRNERDSLVWSEKYPLAGGRGDGHIFIGDNWPPGEYFLEGYAKSSFSSDTTESLHPRRIRIVNRVNEMEMITELAMKQDSLVRATSIHRFDLFPEGGSLHEGVTSVVAFKASYGGGFPEEVSGKVLENGQEITAFRSSHDGMGKFIVTPTLGRTYKVFLDDGRSFPLPEIKQDGLSLHVTRNTSSAIDILISSPSPEPRPFSLLAKLHGLPCGGAEGILKGKQLVRLPMDLFPTQGIVELTLSDEVGRPFAERLVYVHPERRLTITATLTKERYAVRDTGKVRLQVKDASGHPVQAELAVSIFDKAYLYQPGHEDILSHAYLSEQIRGDVFCPSYYFDEKNEDRLAALDLLLMTQGWRRYVWDRDPEPSHPVLHDGISGKDLANNIQYFQVFSPQSDTCLVLSDSLGLFEIDTYLMQQMRGNVYIKPIVTKPKPKIVLVNPFDSINVYRHGRIRHLLKNYTFTKDNDDAVQYFTPETILLDEAVIKARRHSIARDKVTGYLDSLAILASGEWVCEHSSDRGEGYLNDYKGFSHHPEGCPETVYSGKRLKPERGKTYELIKYEPSGRDGDWIVTDIQTVLYTGPQYTEDELLELYGLSKAQGYYPRREFYEPDILEFASPTPDYRNQLQWKAAVLTDENGTAEIPFATSDINTEFIGIVEGIDGTGLLGSHIFSFMVFK